MEQKKIDRINELAHLAKERELTEEEKIERTALRKEYIASVTGSLESQLDNVYFVNKKGKEEKLKRKS